MPSLRTVKRCTVFCLAIFLSFNVACGTGWAYPSHRPKKLSSGHRTPSRGNKFVTAKSYVVVNASDGHILYAKNPDWRLPPASTAKVMTVLIAKEKLSMEKNVVIGRRAAKVPPSKAGLTPGARYTVKALITAALVSSSNDAALALAEAVSGSEAAFTRLMNAKARELHMNNTFFVNATGLTDKKIRQYTTAYDLTTLIRTATRDKFLDDVMGLTETTIVGSDGKRIPLFAHNKMLWRTPKFVKGKTGWTHASRHTFVGTNYDANKSIAFAILSSQKPWADIERLASFGLVLERRR